jgi:hypothetical protein
MKDGTVPQERGLRWVKNNVVARSAESDGTNYVQARAERVLLQIEILKMDLEKKRGTYVTVSDVQMVWAQMASACRTRLLSLPAKLGQLVAVESDPAICQQLIEGELHECLEQLTTDAAAEQTDPQSRHGHAGRGKGHAKGFAGQGRRTQ